MDSTPSSFPRRANGNGTYDSICPKCFRTIATSFHAALLLAAERDHRCEDTAEPWPGAVTVFTLHAN